MRRAARRLFGAGSGLLAEVAEEAVEAGVAASGEAGGLARERAVRVALGGIEIAEMLLDRRQVASGDRTRERGRRAERERILHRTEDQRRERLERNRARRRE